MEKYKKRKKWMTDEIIAIDRNFIPMMVVSRRHAIKALVTERAEVLDVTNWSRLAFYELSDLHGFKVIVYPYTQAIKDSKIVVGRGFRGILERDQHVCQYCGPEGHRASTIDHVMPKSRGGSNHPSNLVAACKFCNQKKGNRTPEEAGMPLIHPIRNFRWTLMEKFHDLTSAWEKRREDAILPV